MKLAPEKQERNVTEVLERKRVAQSKRMMLRKQYAIESVGQKLTTLELGISGGEIEKRMTQPDVLLPFVQRLRLLRSRNAVN